MSPRGKGGLDAEVRDFSPAWHLRVLAGAAVALLAAIFLAWKTLL